MTELRILAALALVSFITGCIDDPAAPAPPSGAVDSAHGMLVVNEGLWYQDNATLTFYDPVRRSAADGDWFARTNPGMRLGDLANAITISSGRAWIPITTSGNVEIIELPSGRSAGRVRLEGAGPREVALIGDSLAIVTLINADQAAIVDARTLSVRQRIDVGPAPEGVTVVAGRALVANSGYGFLRRNEPKAGTVSVIDLSTLQEMRTLTGFANPVALAADTQRSRAYVLDGMPHADSAGRLTELDAITLTPLRTWTISAAGVAGELALDPARGKAFVIDGNGDIVLIDLTTSNQRVIFRSAQYSPTGFYSIGIDPTTGALYVGYARNFTSTGRVLVVTPAGDVLDEFSAGLNPGAFAQY